MFILDVTTVTRGAFMGAFELIVEVPLFNLSNLYLLLCLGRKPKGNVGIQYLQIGISIFNKSILT